MKDKTEEMSELTIEQMNDPSPLIQLRRHHEYAMEHATENSYINSHLYLLTMKALSSLPPSDQINNLITGKEVMPCGCSAATKYPFFDAETGLVHCISCGKPYLLSPSGPTLSRTKIMDVMHTLSCIRDGKVHDARVSANACWEVLNEVLSSLPPSGAASEIIVTANELIGRSLPLIDILIHEGDGITKKLAESSRKDILAYSKSGGIA